MRVPAAEQGGQPCDAVGLTPLEALVAQTRKCCLRPFRFFVSWQGVLTLAYTGFPPALMQLKRDIDGSAGPALKAENPGSRWPKTSLAALRDRSRLTPEQLLRLNTICAEESAAFAAGDDQSLRVCLDRASIAVYACRSLERLLSCRTIAFATGSPDDAEPLPADRQRVLTIVAEADDDDYWFEASRDGNREAHYRGPHIGATLMHRPEAFRDSSPDWHLTQLVRSFRERVERELPSMYVWFAEHSLHVTLRALES